MKKKILLSLIFCNFSLENIQSLKEISPSLKASPLNFYCKSSSLRQGVDNQIRWKISERIATDCVQPQKAQLQEKHSLVMLAHSWRERQEIAGWWMSEKLDGIRAYWNGEELLSRNGNTIHAPYWFTKGFPDFALDGELWVGREQFAKTLSIVSKDLPGEQWTQVRYMVFDAPERVGTFEERFLFLSHHIQEKSGSYLQLVQQRRCWGTKHLEKELAAVIRKKGEGLMLRKPHSQYEYKRSYALLKVKGFREGEALVLQYIPGKGKHEGRMGSLLVSLASGVHFAIGTGFSDQERNEPPVIGSKIKFRYQNLTRRGKPRFATFLSLVE